MTSGPLTRHRHAEVCRRLRGNSRHHRTSRLGFRSHLAAIVKQGGYGGYCHQVHGYRCVLVTSSGAFHRHHAFSRIALLTRQLVVTALGVNTAVGSMSTIAIPAEPEDTRPPNLKWKRKVPRVVACPRKPIALRHPTCLRKHQSSVFCVIWSCKETIA